MTYAYGMKGVPAIGGGLGGLPRRRPNSSIHLPTPNLEPTILYYPGQAWPEQGGFFGGMIRHEDGSVYALVVADKSSEEVLALKQTDGVTPGSESVYDGYKNTLAAIEEGLDSHPAAAHCVNYRGGGFSDWYLGAVKEFSILFTGNKPTTATVSTVYGVNPYSIPPRLTNYTASDPSRTWVQDFIGSGPQAFRASLYRTSTWDSTRGRVVYFDNGREDLINPGTSGRVRPIRRVKVSPHVF